MIGLVVLSACKSNTLQKYSKEGFALGTFISITLYSEQAVNDQLFKDVFTLLDQIEKTMTINKDVNSEIEQINAAAGKDAVQVSEETFSVLQTAREYTLKTEGHFDITVGALVKLWNIGFDNAKVPSDTEIDSALQDIGIQDLTLNEANYSVKLEREGMIIDLGGIAKGYAADAVAQLIIDQGIDRALINLGGNVLCIGYKPDEIPFKIGIRDPNGSAADYLGIVTVVDNSVVTSGVYERNFTENDIMYHHIIDTATGYPVDNNLESVSIITTESIVADALSTGVFSMGLEKGFEFVQKLEGVEAIFVTKEKEIYLTEGAKKLFELTADGYTLVESPSVEVMNPQEEVEFKDAVLEDVVRTLLNKSQEEALTRLDCSRITQIHVIGNQVLIPDQDGKVDYKANYSARLDMDYIVSYSTSEGGESSQRGEIQSLEDISYFINLQELALLKQKVSDITPLQGHRRLKMINFADNQIQDISPIGNNQSLTTIICSGNQIRDISDLDAIISSLVDVRFERNLIENADVLSKGIELTYMMMGYNNIQTYPDLSKIKKIGNADFIGNPCDY